MEDLSRFLSIKCVENFYFATFLRSKIKHYSFFHRKRKKDRSPRSDLDSLKFLCVCIHFCKILKF